MAFAPSSVAYNVCPSFDIASLLGSLPIKYEPVIWPVVGSTFVMVFPVPAPADPGTDNRSEFAEPLYTTSLAGRSICRKKVAEFSGVGVGVVVGTAGGAGRGFAVGISEV